jgi:hypothetical protein
MVMNQAVLESHHFFAVSESGTSRALPRPAWYSMQMGAVGPESTEFRIEVSGCTIGDGQEMMHPLVIPNRTFASLVGGGFIQQHVPGLMLTHRTLRDAYVGGHRVFRWASWQTAPRVPEFSPSQGRSQQ